MYILDTDTLSLVHAGHERIGRKKNRVDPSEIATTLVTIIEILRARHSFLLKAADGDQLLRAQQWLQHSEHLLEQIVVIPFDRNAADEFDQLRRQKKLKGIGRADLLLASIVLARRDVLVSRNLRHFQQIPGLKVENWAD